jgi:bifunctional UDP-N-acetylglucosamine pyrophosphorylase / glucosamine-1-phosphate N-acetyltransferase
MNRIDNITFIVLAAGNGSRFGDSRSKLLYDLCGQPVLNYVLNLTKGFDTIVVTSNHIKSHVPSDFNIVIQSEPKGTGDAFLTALEHIPEDHHVFILLGDMPLMQETTIKMAIDELCDHDLVFGKFRSRDQNKYGRVLQSGNKYCVLEYPEHPASSEFYNAGWLALHRNFIRSSGSIAPSASGEIYLTSYIGLAAKCCAIEVSESQCIGINTMSDYSRAYDAMRHILVERAFMSGADFVDPQSVQMNYDTILGQGCKVYPHVVFGSGVSIGQGTQILPFSFIEQSTIGENCIIGPSCYIKNNTQVMNHAHIGAFCEVKHSIIGNNSKAKHLSYIGDADIGDNGNVGAGTVFLNYDGKNKNKSIVEDNAFLGGNSAYVAPVTVGANSYVGAGTVVRTSIEPNSLFVSKPTNLKCRRRG